MNRQELANEISRLDVSQKLLLVEDIWDQIAAANTVLPLIDEQRQELDCRYHDYKEGRVTLHEPKAVYAELRAKYG